MLGAGSVKRAFHKFHFRKGEPVNTQSENFSRKTERPSPPPNKALESHAA